MKLAVLKGFQDHDNVVISCLPFAVGRCRSADFIIPHVNVSRNHCKIIKESELWKIYDFSSSGTFVNDSLIGQGKSVILREGDRIRFGALESNLCWTFHPLDVSSENSDSGSTPKNQILPHYNEKYCTKGKHCSNKVNNVNATFNELPEKKKEILGQLDLNFKKTNEEFLEVKQEKGTNVQGIANWSHPKENSHSVKENSIQEKTETEKINELTKELQQVRKALSKLEEKNCGFQRDPTVETSNTTKPSADANLLENLADLMETELQCTICSELFVTAVTLSCTHTFCKYCINQWKRKQKTCPICRKKISSETRSLVLDNYIDKMVGNLSVELKERREAIIQERSEVGPQKKKSKLRN